MDLAKQIPLTNKVFTDYMPPKKNCQIDIRPVTSQELLDISKSFKRNKAPGYDDITINIIKDTIDIITEPLKNIINLTFTAGVFPEKLKTAKVTAVFKNDNPQKVENYRPISILPSFSKFFEKALHNRIMDFLDKFNILNPNQFGFRKNHSTSLALTHLINKVTSAVDESKITGGVFLDLSKAFDTLDHNLLIHKLDYYGISGVALNWIRSYLENRQQFVQYNGRQSVKQNIVCGIPQGSILGPLLFS